MRNHGKSLVRPRRGTLCVTASALALLVGTHAGDRPRTAAAVPRCRPPLLLPLSRHHVPRFPGPFNRTSTNWGGYAIYNVSNVTDVKGTWIVPTAQGSSCSSAYSSSWV